MLALGGIRVLDLTHLAPGAFCTMILGDLGADVIRIEAVPEAGARRLSVSVSPAKEEWGRQAAYNALYRNKKSIGLNLKTEKGREVFYRLSEKADVIIEGFRPGVVKRLGVDYETIKKINPKIVYCSLSGYGQDGPYRDFPGHDINYISIAGVLALIGEGDRLPVVPLNLIADFAGASLHGVIGILAALIAREKTDKGQYVDISYTDGAISLLTFLISSYFETEIVPRRGASALSGAYPYYAIYETKDNKLISIGCLEPWFWERLCRALNREDLLPYGLSFEHFFSKPEDEKWKKATSSLRQIFLTRTREEWFELLTKADIPVGKVYDLNEVFSDPQVIHRQMVIELEDPVLGKMKQVGIPIKLSETPGKVRHLMAYFGQHTEELLLEAGYTRQEINQLRETGDIG